MSRLVTHNSETITAPSWEEAVSVLELLVTKLDKLDPKNRIAVHLHLQVSMFRMNWRGLTLFVFRPRLGSLRPWP